MKNVAQILAFSTQNEIPGGRVQGFILAGEIQGAVLMQVSVSGRETLRPIPVCQGGRHCSSAGHTLLCMSGKKWDVVKKSLKNT